ncbi:MAG: hypothetical protein FWG30_11320 [Eubacteriaceae bacterium]|jgi:hypothetical protein|nr:hypothetical protein [Eubacteriaceae bacterium]
MKKTIAGLALVMLMLAAFMPVVYALADWVGDPTAMDESEALAFIDDAPDDIIDYGYSAPPPTGDSPYAYFAYLALCTAGAVGLASTAREIEQRL